MTNPTDNVFTVKPPKWERLYNGSLRAETPFGAMFVDEQADKRGSYYMLPDDAYAKQYPCDTASDAMAKAETWYFSRLLPALEPVKGEARGGDFTQIIDECRTAQHGLTGGVKECNRCDSSVGHICECCYAAFALGRAITALSSQSAALIPAPAADAGVVGRLVEALEDGFVEAIPDGSQIAHSVSKALRDLAYDIRREMSRDRLEGDNWESWHDWLDVKADQFDAALALAADAGNAREKREVGK